MRWIALAAAILLAACASEAERAEKEYEMVAKAAIVPRDKCEAARKVEAAYLREGDERKYRAWNSIADGMCL